MLLLSMYINKPVNTLYNMDDGLFYLINGHYIYLASQ